jgi:exoribonuclease-2
LAIDLDEAGGPAGLEMVPSWLHVTRLTYEAADKAIAGGDEILGKLYDLALAYHDERIGKGAVAIDLPEVDVKVQEGQVSFKPILPLRSRSLVEETMVRAGAAIAAYAIAHDIVMPYAMQEAPEARPRPKTLAEMYAARRAFKPRRYVTAPAPHAGLGLAAYVQVTSPMRRYLDLVAHQQLRAHLRGAAVFDTAAMVERIGEVEAVSGGLRQAERLSDQHWTIVYLLRHPGWHGEGILVEKHGLSGLVLVPELGYEARVHLPSDLPLDSRVTLTLTEANLPRLDARFRVS